MPELQLSLYDEQGPDIARSSRYKVYNYQRFMLEIKNNLLIVVISQESLLRLL